MVAPLPNESRPETGPGRDRWSSTRWVTHAAITESYSPKDYLATVIKSLAVIITMGYKQAWRDLRKPILSIIGGSRTAACRCKSWQAKLAALSRISPKLKTGRMIHRSNSL
jgi:hypothetical protein